jgi:hypothetical protein
MCRTSVSRVGPLVRIGDGFSDIAVAETVAGAFVLVALEGAGARATAGGGAGGFIGTVSGFAATLTSIVGDGDATGQNDS